MAKKNLERKNEIKDLKEVMSTAGGRRFLWRQLGIAGVFQPCYNPEAEGGRRVGLQLLQEIVEEAPGDYLKMQQEQIQKSTNAKIAKDNKKREGKNEDATA